jgi:hypothetical protein
VKVKVARSLETVQPGASPSGMAVDNPPGGTPIAHLRAARNEFESFQIVVRNDAPGRLTPSDQEGWEKYEVPPMKKKRSIPPGSTAVLGHGQPPLAPWRRGRSSRPAVTDVGRQGSTSSQSSSMTPACSLTEAAIELVPVMAALSCGPDFTGELRGEHLGAADRAAAGTRSRVPAASRGYGTMIEKPPPPVICWFDRIS